MTAPYEELDGLVRVYPATTPNGTGLVWAHGGGFSHGDLDMPESDWVARQLAARGTTVVSVDYRLAPEHPFPAASDDMLTAWQWARANAEAFGVRLLAIGGTSAGGNLAAGAGLRLAGTDEAPALVLLAYPTLMAVQPAPDAELRAALDADPSADRFPPASVLAMYERYLGGTVDDAPLAAIPGNATASDLGDYPPTLILNGDADELRVSGEHFASTLAAAGRDVEVLTEPGTHHGHLNRPDEAPASRSIERMAARISALLA
ncbi:alpha/beta hydrolase [Microbacterium sp. M28]|uniref:alpha/beta hydrolase n=1 Tax=Microbacterium sp. M28 TaxID=2962064 RepID=UPI0021F4F587|nr:alpha/beta hydrolase [Microbacterium sp. M28]UYO96603.1 alpha/beta hydrolase [Microbacterium sp. M28]